MIFDGVSLFGGFYDGENKHEFEESMAQQGRLMSSSMYVGGSENLVKPATANSGQPRNVIDISTGRNKSDLGREE